MDRRSFLTGLLGFAGATAIASSVEAAPLTRPMGVLDALQNDGLQAPDGTPIEQHKRVDVGLRRMRAEGPGVGRPLGLGSDGAGTGGGPG